eukprot:Platyproteum_vivax@DN4371_c0_g1_i1.p1
MLSRLFRRNLVKRPFMRCVSNIAVDCERAEAIGVVRMCRQQSLNALSSEMCDELVDEMKTLDDTPDIRCIVLTGDGDRAFAVGADIKEMADMTVEDAIKQGLFEKIRQISKLKTPIVAAVNGLALGGGCELAMMCDIIIASEKASFGQPEVCIGTIPGMGGSQRLVAAIGKSKAMEWILTGRKVSAEEAERAGLVARVVPEKILMVEALRIASTIASYSKPIVRIAKAVINEAAEAPLEAAIRNERMAFLNTFALKDRKRGMKAFIAKETPEWLH